MTTTTIKVMRPSRIFGSMIRPVLLTHQRKFYFDSFLVTAHRTCKGPIFVIIAVGWLHTRKKQLQSASRTTPSRNRRQRGWIKAIWLWHRTRPRGGHHAHV